MLAIRLAKPCQDCEGCGKVYNYPDYKGETCIQCKGLGEVPTEAGQELLRFLSVHYTKTT